ncbi:MAG: hypothetical protein PVI97_08265 [Candidatus Thiodiazotropha sp.]
MIQFDIKTSHVTVGKLALALLISFLLPISGQAEEIWLPASETDCHIEGWSKDKSPKGLKVRGSGNFHAPVLGTLPAYINNYDSYSFGVEFKIVGSHDGWIKITGAKDDPNRSNLPLRHTYAGTGWIPGESVDFRVQSGTGYVRPDAESTKLIELKSDWLTPMASIERVVACYKDWALLDYSFIWRRDKKTMALEKLTLKEQLASNGRAWFRGICANQETTCEISWP